MSRKVKLLGFRAAPAPATAVQAPDSRGAGRGWGAPEWRKATVPAVPLLPPPCKHSLLWKSLVKQQNPEEAQ